MASVSATNAGVTDLLQTLSSASPTLSSALSSTAVQTALQNSSLGDLVQLSQAALQLQQVTGLFGGGDPSQTSSQDPTALLLQSLGQGTSETGNSVSLLA